MKEEKFQVINFIRKLILEIDKELNNFPKKDIELKNRIRTNSYDLLELSYEANTISDISNKKIILEKMIAKIKVLDFLLFISNIFSILTTAYFSVVCNIVIIAIYSHLFDILSLFLHVFVTTICYFW